MTSILTKNTAMEHFRFYSIHTVGGILNFEVFQNKTCEQNHLVSVEQTY